MTTLTAVEIDQAEWQLSNGLTPGVNLIAEIRACHERERQLVAALRGRGVCDVGMTLYFALDIPDADEARLQEFWGNHPPVTLPAIALFNATRSIVAAVDARERGDQ